MIKNCLRSQKDFFNYDIMHKGEKIANAHLLSMRDKSVVFGSEENKIWVENTHDMIIKALNNWEFADDSGMILPINKETLDDLEDDYYMSLVNGITEHELAVQQEAKDIEKN